MKPQVILFSLCLVHPALAQEGPSFDCTSPNGMAEQFVCADPDLSRLDRVLADRFAAAIDAVQALDVGSKEAEDLLRTYQRGWIKGRDDCWKSTDPRSCIRDAYLMREGQLVAEWMIETPTATAFWTCGGSASNEVVTMFFDTELPSVRFERGDSIDSGSLSPTGSGSRYDGSFGRYIWIKGNEAEYREHDPDGSTYSCTLSSEG